MTTEPEFLEPDIDRGVILFPLNDDEDEDEFFEDNWSDYDDTWEDDEDDDEDL